MGAVGAIVGILATVGTTVYNKLASDKATANAKRAAAADLALKKQGVARQVRQNTLQTIQNAAVGSTLARWQTELAQEHLDELNSTECKGTYVRPSEERQEELRKENEKQAQEIARLDTRGKQFNGNTVDS